MAINTETPNWTKLGAIHSQRKVLIKLLLSKFQDLLGRRGRKTVRVRGDEQLHRARSYRGDRADAHMNSQKLQQHAQGLHRSIPDKTPAWRRDVDTKSHPEPQSK